MRTHFTLFRLPCQPALELNIHAIAPQPCRGRRRAMRHTPLFRLSPAERSAFSRVLQPPWQVFPLLQHIYSGITSSIHATPDIFYLQYTWAAIARLFSITPLDLHVNMRRQHFPLVHNYHFALECLATYIDASIYPRARPTASADYFLRAISASPHCDITKSASCHSLPSWMR